MRATIIKVQDSGRKGDHVHMRIFAGLQEGSLGKCGDLVMRTTEAQLFESALALGTVHTGGQLRVIIDSLIGKEDDDETR